MAAILASVIGTALIVVALAGVALADRGGRDGSRLEPVAARTTADGASVRDDAATPTVPRAGAPWTKQPHGKRPHGKQPHGKQPHAKQPHAKQPHGKQPHGKQPHGKQPHGKQPHAKQPHRKQPHRPSSRAASAATLQPTDVRIASIGVDAPLVPLGLNPDGTIQVPDRFDVAGWYVYRPVPGQRGPSVIAAHVDSKSGPATFFRLRELQPGAVVDVDRNDGTTARFVVTAVEQHPKVAFPTVRVYGPTRDPELRLLTCGGRFDWSSHHYTDNVIVFARLDRIVR
jgi:sortase (surface protein transpeptidase)